MPSFAITRLDSGQEEFAQILPLRAQLVRVMPGWDRPDYLLCAPERLIPFRPPAGLSVDRIDPAARTVDARGELVSIQALVVCTRLVGDAFRVGMHDLAVNIAYVLDLSLIHDSEVDFGKLAFAATGFIDDVPDADAAVA